MFKRYSFVLVAALLAAGPVLADSSTDDKECGPVAKACVDAGYARGDKARHFWDECMKPLLLNKSVANTNVDAGTIKTCRSVKIEQLTNDLNELKSVQG